MNLGTKVKEGGENVWGTCRFSYLQAGFGGKRLK